MGKVSIAVRTRPLVMLVRLDEEEEEEAFALKDCGLLDISSRRSQGFGLEGGS